MKNVTAAAATTIFSSFTSAAEQHASIDFISVPLLHMSRYDGEKEDQLGMNASILFKKLADTYYSYVDYPFMDGLGFVFCFFLLVQ